MNEPLTRHFSKSVSSVYIFLECCIYLRHDQQSRCLRFLSNCVKGIGKFTEQTPALTLLNTPQGCDLCLFLPFFVPLLIYHQPTCTFHFKDASLLPLIIPIVMSNNYTSWKYLYTLPYSRSMIYLLLSHERVISPFIAFLDLLPVDTLVY